MNEKVRNKWVEALRSGEYKQGVEYLRPGDDKYCCLGVLCDLHSKETGTPWIDNEDDRWCYGAACGALPSFVQEWAGLSSADPIVNTSAEARRYLSDLNDSAGVDFNYIANLIEKGL